MELKLSLRCDGHKMLLQNYSQQSSMDGRNAQITSF